VITNYKKFQYIDSSLSDCVLGIIVVRDVVACQGDSSSHILKTSVLGSQYNGHRTGRSWFNPGVEFSVCHHYVQTCCEV
jgi:hypothetical protein